MRTRHASSRLVIPVGPEDYALGNPHAKLTLVEYGDYACPYSRHAFGNVSALRRWLGGSLRFVFRHFPVVDRDPLAQEAAEAALAAGAQGRFWEAHELLFSSDLDRLLGDPAAMGEGLKLDVPRFTTELREGRYRARVADEAEGGVRSGIHGTPTFFINGVHFAGSWELHSLMHALRARLRALPGDRAALGAATL
ncbi:MAG: DsbA family protein [Myxococcaceae bacterium]